MCVCGHMEIGGLCNRLIDRKSVNLVKWYGTFTMEETTLPVMYLRKL